MALEISEVEPLEVGEEVVPKVVLDVAGGADDDPPRKKSEDTADRRQGQQD